MSLDAFQSSKTGQQTHQVVVVVFEQAQMLDVAGPADTFSLANRFAPELHYQVRCVSSRGGLLACSNGLQINTLPIDSVPVTAVDTLIVSGGEQQGLALAVEDTALRDWVREAARHVQRLVSVCTGAFALAAWGLLNQRHATTHWAYARKLQRQHPDVQVDLKALYVCDDNIWTAGGVTTGIDMSLAMIEADTSRLIAGQVAGALVMSSRRVGNQAQYSLELRAQTGRYAQLIDWIAARLADDLSVPVLAAYVNESERSFCRRFVAEVGQTPGRFIEQLRLMAAKKSLEGGASVKAAARASGFQTAEQLSRVFRRCLAMSPQDYRNLHGVQ